MLSSIGSGLNCKSLNINTGYVAGVLAVSLKVEITIVLTTVNGIYYESKGKLDFISSINCREIRGDDSKKGILSDGIKIFIKVAI